MNGLPSQGELFTLRWERPDPRRLRVNDVIRIDGRLGRIIRVTDCAAVVLMHHPAREFTTRFDKRVRFQPSAITFRIQLTRKPKSSTVTRAPSANPEKGDPKWMFTVPPVMSRGMYITSGTMPCLKRP